MNIHFIAIGGAIMHQLAIISHKKGIKVSGSDDEIADPARSNLLQEGLLPPQSGWFSDKITTDLDAVILGMHAKEDNPELLKARQLNIPIYAFPEYIYKMAQDKKRVVVAGSHGKTTTTSMIMHVLKSQDVDFDYLVGAKVQGFDYSVKISEAPLFIIEGDEYPASVLEKRPKIHFYHPHIAVLTGIAWDHVNVFPTYENYWSQFKIFLDQMAAESTVIYNAADKEVIRLMETETAPVNKLPYATPSYQVKDHHVVLTTTEGQVTLRIFGDHNLENMEAARKTCNALGISDYNFYKAIATFTGAARRLEQIREDENLVIFRDFAHAPSKLKATLKAVRRQYAQYYLIACFELHTFSSLSQNFLDQYAESMKDCDAGAVFYSKAALALKKLPDLDISRIKAGFKDESLNVFEHKDSLKDWIEAQIHAAQRPVCLLLMSSGTFEGMDIENLKA